MPDTMCVVMKDGRKGWVDEHMSNLASKDLPPQESVTLVRFGSTLKQIRMSDVVTTYSGTATPQGGTEIRF